MTTELWLCIRRMLRRRSRSRDVARTVAGWRADEAARDHRHSRRRERLDLIEGWVSEDADHHPNNAKSSWEKRQPRDDGSNSE